MNTITESRPQRATLGLPGDNQPPKKPLTPSTPAPNPAWNPMSSAPKDGSFVYLLGDEKRAEWYYYNTRQFRKGTFQPVGWWRMRFGPNGPPPFTPTGWRRVSEGWAA